MAREDGPVIGSATVLVAVGGSVLTLIGVIVEVTTLLHFKRKHDGPVFPDKLTVTEQELFAIIDVTNAILPPGFPLSIAQLTASDVAVNVDDIILITPVEEG